MNYYSNLKRYDRKGNRVSVFGREIGDKIEVFVLKCSRKDQFIKSVSRGVYEQYLDGVAIDNYHPEIFDIIVDEFSPKVTFLKWVSSKYLSEIILDVEYDEAIIGKPKVVYSNKNKAFEIKMLTA